MTITPFETALYEKLYGFFAGNGFVLLPDKKQFRKITDTGFQNVIFTVSTYEEEIWLEVNFGIRHEQIEQMAQQFLNNMRDFWPDTNTLVISIGKYNDARYFRYKVHNDIDLEDVCEEIKDFLEHQGFLFMQQSETLAALHKILNEKPSKPCKYVYNQVHRYYKGVIAARLINADNFLDLADSYRFFLTKIGATAEEQHAYERLLSYLLYHSIN
ncbi:hypothetical protein SAMN04515674_104171 [Pseudarcicella hirudinis]|uniref:DUF4304 domain-containing protein n=1 Tax=Pseudarcicella hirudinis TaxID=1079859 RepID=A0A1I5RNS4_9BACT|nr:hypothetical protein [Pseudarcicella hirudinis]SFP60204.1 hypothetical protein SAMN04515674_104171 [Pseudarcicella hirudinis]